jgi:internalin A
VASPVGTAVFANVANPTTQPADQKAQFADPHLHQVVASWLGTDPSFPIYRSEIERKLTESGEYPWNDLQGKGITNLEGIQIFKGLLRNTAIALNNNRISDLTPLSSLTDLRELSINRNNVKDLSPLKSLVSLNYLQLTDNQIVDVTPLKSLVSLKGLDLEGNRITDISPLKHLSELDSFTLSSDYIKDFYPLGQLLNLTSLRVSGEHYGGPAGVGQLNSLNLQQLYLSSNQITDITNIRIFKHLTKLFLANNPVVDFSSLGEMKQLVQVDLHSTGIKDVRFLKNLTELRELDLSSNKIQDIDYLRGLQNINNVSLSNNHVTDIEVLEGLKQLQGADVRFNPLHEQSLDVIRKLENRGVRVSYNMVQNIQVRPGIARLDQPISVSVKVIENGTGLKSVALNCMNHFTKKKMHVDLSFNAKTGLWEGTLAPKNKDNAGIWVIDSVTFTDNGGSQGQIDTKNLQKGNTVEFTVNPLKGTSEKPKSLQRLNHGDSNYDS